LYHWAARGVGNKLASLVRIFAEREQWQAAH
jgi:hypothetical protein